MIIKAICTQYEEVRKEVRRFDESDNVWTVNRDKKGAARGLFPVIFKQSQDDATNRVFMSCTVSMVFEKTVLEEHSSHCAEYINL